MKKLLLLSAAIAVGASSFAQNNLSVGNRPSNALTEGKKAISSEVTAFSTGKANSNAKTTAITDTVVSLTAIQFNRLFGSSATYFNLVSTDSGAYFGTNALNRTAYGEWFQPLTYGTDTTASVIGVLSLWRGTVQANSTKSVDFKLWDVDMTTQTMVGTNVYLMETPGTAVATKNVTFLSIMADINDTNYTIAYFPTPQVMTAPFYVGYETNYTFNALNGDTLGLYSTPADSGWFHGAAYYDTTTQGVDTILLAQSVFKSGTTWGDVFWNDGNDINMSIAPLYHLDVTTNVKGITKNSLTLFGNYPNPATNSTNIKISLDKTADVTIKIMDVTGRILNTVTESKLATGEHHIPVSTANLAAGNYIYLVTTSTGANLAAQFTVTK